MLEKKLIEKGVSNKELMEFARLDNHNGKKIYLGDYPALHVLGI